MTSISHLQPGDTIGIAAAASHFSRDAFLEGVTLLEKMGYRVIYRPDIFERAHELAGTDARRLDELHDLFSRRDVKAILFARGGWGMQRIVSQLDRALIEKNPKLILGYSDLTTLHLYLYGAFQWPFIYGPVVAKDLALSFSDDARCSLDSALTGSYKNRTLTLTTAHAIRSGTVAAPIVGGCLTLLMTASGTPYGVPFKNKILFIEDVGEKPYAIDRMLTHLRETGRLDGIRGVLCGQFKNCGDDQRLQEIIIDHFDRDQVPIIWNAPYGHGHNMHCLPLGISCTLTANQLVTLNF